ncbi:hypothetical protein PIB30_013192 [Stylosanthes scabra]|uniref:Uncharacterized protein n=1 Tax=Stylosanthes scabra TaxID=79078 RepID=A0ABU6Z6W2_9FABA|nr:hypothetical protein [Stylosanthes scabra]
MGRKKCVPRRGGYSSNPRPSLKIPTINIFINSHPKQTSPSPSKPMACTKTTNRRHAHEYIPCPSSSRGKRPLIKEEEEDVHPSPPSRASPSRPRQVKKPAKKSAGSERRSVEEEDVSNHGSGPSSSTNSKVTLLLHVAFLVTQMHELSKGLKATTSKRLLKGFWFRRGT